MFNWVKNKIRKKMSTEQDGCIRQNLNFVNFSRSRDSHQIENEIREVYEGTNEIKSRKKINEPLSPEDSARNLDLNMICRKIWANYYGGSNSKFDKEFLKD